MVKVKKVSENTTDKSPEKKPKQHSEKKINSNRVYSTGKRKNAIARVWITPGSGKIIVNTKNVEEYFPRETHVNLILQPFIATKTSGQYDIACSVKGGGCSGQSGAVAHGIARALDKIAPALHQDLSKGKFLTRDPRVVERKKYGKHKARKSTQFSKR